jgi:ATP-binding cassette, subfamily C, bacteriocin exporter
VKDASAYGALMNWNRFPLVLQHDATDCGAAALAMIARHYGMNVSIGHIRQWAGVDRQGANLFGLMKAAEKIGFTAKGVKGDWDGLCKVPLPLICHTVNESKFGHFVVVHKIAKNIVHVADPGCGLVKLTREEFCQRWTGYALLLTPAALKPEPKKGSSKWAFVRELASPHTGIVAAAVVCSLIMTLLGLGTSFFVQHLVDNILVHSNSKALTFALVGMVLLLLFRALFDVVRSYYLIDVARKVDLALLACYMRHVMHMPMNFFETRRVGEILSRLNDAIKIRQLISGTALTAIVDGTMIVVTSAVMLLTDWRLAIMCLAFAPLIVGTVLLIRKPLAKRQRDLMERSAQLESQLVEDLSGIETIKASGMADRRLLMTESKLVGIAKTILSSGNFGVVLQLSTFLLIGGATLGVLGYGGFRVIDGHLTIGKLMFFYSLTHYLYDPLQRLANVGASLQDAAIAMDRLWEILCLELEEPKQEGKRKAKIKTIQSGLRLTNVSFQYGYREEVLKSINLDIPAGKVVALVGESGSGKSTVCKLLAGFYEPTKGTITIDSCNLKDLSVAPWRRRIGYVPQDPHVFSGTIVENIAFGRPRAPMSKIERAAKLAGLTDFIEKLPERYNTMVGERGLNMSGGQRQRLAIARAVLANPQLFIFDEATSHLDTKTERAMQAMLREVMRGRTALIVAHRLSTVRDADIICVLKDGRVAEQGNHCELMMRRGLYWALWCAQTEHEPVAQFQPAVTAAPAAAGA